MDYRSGGLICDLHLRPRPHRARWIGDDTYNPPRTDGLSRQQWRDNQEGDRREHRECWNDTTGEIKIQDCKPRTRNIHRTFLNLLARSTNSAKWIIDKNFDGIYKDIKPAINLPDCWQGATVLLITGH